MARKNSIDGFGATALVLFAVLMGINQVVIKLGNAGLQPVFFAALRSFGAAICVWMLFAALGRVPRLRRQSLPAGLLLGTLFALEFVFLFNALDLTTVSRTSVIFYTMPVWLALAGHFLLPGERLTFRKVAGLALAFGGVAWAILSRDSGAEGSLTGDVLALCGALCWAGIALCVRLTRLSNEPAEVQLFWQVLVSGPILLALAPLFGPLLRSPDWVTWAGLGFQIVAVVTLGFAVWLWLLSIYPAADVAAFGFLSPLFGVAFGWLLLGERPGAALWVALLLVAAGLWLISHTPRRQSTLGYEP